MSFEGILYKFLAIIDKIVYDIATALFDIILKIVDESGNVFGFDQINDIANKVYVILGVLMLFKLVISAIQYMINPDTFDDKEKGMGGILKRLGISLLLIAVVPSVFSFLMSIENEIVKTIPKVIYNEDLNTTSGKSYGEELSSTVLVSFVTINKEAIADGVSETNEIVDTKSLVEHIDENCPKSGLFGSDNHKCKYSYMFIVSTGCGVFICYVLIIMAFDIVIRTIKFSLVRILAPIPISGYVMNKEKLTKFVKMAFNIYIDLFIRLAIMYFIILTVHIVMESQFFQAANNEPWVTAALIRIILIFGLLMFAKNAPKFLADLLGIPDVGSGDFKDMFSASRITGVAGALANPIRNFGGNWKTSWANNVDMEDPITGKGRGKRIADSFRHALGGAARGVVDSAHGLYSGDDWGKIDQRLRKSLDKSNRRSAQGFMERTSKLDADKMNEEITKRMDQIMVEFKAAGFDDLDKLLKNAKIGASAKYNEKLKEFNQNIESINHQLATGMDLNGNKLNETQINNLRTQLATATADRDKFINDKDDFINDEIAQVYSNTAKYAVEDIVFKKKEKRKANDELIAKRREELKDTNLSQSERRRKEEELLQLVNENKQIDEDISAEGQEKLRQHYVDEIKEFADKRDKNYEFNELTGKYVLKKEKADISRVTIAQGKIDKFFGGEGFTGKGYIDTADLLKNNRSSLYTGEAMTKMRQNADVLVDEKGEPATFVAKFTKPGVTTKLTYAEMADLKRKADNGSIDPKDLEKYGFENSAMIQSAFEDIEKQAAEAYVTANISADDPSVESKFKLKIDPATGKRVAANSTIIEGIKRMKAQIASADIPKEEKDALLKELSEKPGQFFKKASDMQEKMRTKGSRISAYNSGKKDNGS